MYFPFIFLSHPYYFTFCLIIYVSCTYYFLLDSVHNFPIVPRISIRCIYFAAGQQRSFLKNALKLFYDTKQKAYLHNNVKFKIILTKIQITYRRSQISIRKLNVQFGYICIL